MLEHISAVDQRVYYANEAVLAAHVRDRHIYGHGDTFTSEFMAPGNLPASMWEVVCRVLDRGSFVDGLGADGLTHTRKWYLNFNGQTGYGMVNGQAALFKGVELVSQVDSFDGTNEGYLVTTLYPKGILQANSSVGASSAAAASKS